MFFKAVHINREPKNKLSQMLKQLQEIPKNCHSVPEVSQLLEDIDDTIAHANDAVIKRALERSGLSSEEMISLLQESRSHVTNLHRLRDSRFDSNEHNPLSDL